MTTLVGSEKLDILDLLRTVAELKESVAELSSDLTACRSNLTSWGAALEQLQLDVNEKIGQEEFDESLSIAEEYASQQAHKYYNGQPHSVMYIAVCYLLSGKLP